MTIDDDKQCIECGANYGITTAGICLKCVGQIMRGKPVRTEVAKKIAEAIDKSLKTDTR